MDEKELDKVFSPQVSHPPHALATVFFALLLLLLLPAPAAAQPGAARGIGVDIRADDGSRVKLYDKSYALVVGVSDYTNGWRDLPGVRHDVVAVRAALEGHGFQVVVVEDADSGRLEKAYADFIRQYGMREQNRLLFYFAGHGHTQRQSYGEEMGYIVPADAPTPTRDLDGFLSKAMDMQEVERYAKRIQSKHALFLFDSCFSGSLFATTRSISDLINYKTARPVRQFITSGSADESVPDRSIFREQFVSALEGEADANRDGYITGTELGEFLQDRVINYSRNAQHPQYGKIRNPNLDKGDFVFMLPQPLNVKGLASSAMKQPSPPPVQPIDPAAIELAFWNSIRDGTDPEEYKAYLEKYPEGTYSVLAKRRIQLASSPADGNAIIRPRISNNAVATPAPSHAAAQGDTSRAAQLYNQNQFAAARDEVRRITAADPNNSSAWRLAGFAAYQLKQYPEAAADLQRAHELRLAAKEDDPELADKLAETLVLAEQFDRALPLLVAATTRAGAKPDAVKFYYRGLAEYRTNKLAEAERSFAEAVRLDPKSAISLFYLGRISYERGQPDAAVAALNRATAADPKLAQAWTLLTLAYLSRAGQTAGTPKADADYLNAVRTSEALIRLRADESSMVLNGQALIGAKQYARAATVLERAAAAPTAGGPTLYLLGVAHSRAKTFPKAVAALERAAAKSPDDLNVYRELGYALEVSRQYAKALAAYERGAQLAPDDADFKQSAERVRPFAK